MAAWMTDVLEKYDPAAILEPTFYIEARLSFSLSAKISTLVETRTSKVALHNEVAGLSTMGAQQVSDSSASNDMPSYFRDQSAYLGP